jgi:hypothetical protein
MKLILAGRLPFVLLAAVPLAACSPTSISLEQSTGAPHDLVMVLGNNLAFSAIVWDGNAIPGGFLGGYMFSVPPGASAGAHTVVIRNSWGQSTALTFTVNTPNRAFPKPRIDYVTLLGASFGPAGHVSAGLYVQGANFDVGAAVEIDGTIVATQSHKGLRADRHGVPETELAYPIYHYLSTFALSGDRPPDARKLQLRVKNLDGQMSEPFTYTLPADAASMDSDGDNLLDSWERSGYDANADGIIDVDLPALGADPDHRDVLLELDVMDNIQFPPGPDVFNGLREVYRSAPVLNPLSDSGINLILDTSGKPCLQAPTGGLVCSFQTVCFDAFGASAAAGCANSITLSEARFSALKAQSFDDAHRGRIFHYGIWGIAKDDGVSGQSDFADDFVVAFDLSARYPTSYQTPRSKVEAITHELGHDFGQLHGGADDERYKPNYWSVMSYAWDFRTAWVNNQRRLDSPTCAPFYYANKDAVEVGGAVPSTLFVPPGSTTQVQASQYLVVDYSEGMARSLIVRSGATAQICGQPIVWSGLGLADGQINDFANWRDLKYDGPELNERP